MRFNEMSPERRREIARMGGKETARRHPGTAKKLMEKLHKNPNMAAWRKKGGNASVASGKLAQVRDLPQSLLARAEFRKRIDSADEAVRQEWAVKGGRIAGQKNVKSGHMERMRARINWDNVRSAARRWAKSPSNLERLERIRELQKSPSNEEIVRLHKRLPGWQYDIFINPKDGGNKIQVDAFRGKVCVFYDGRWWHGPQKQKERKMQDRRQTERLECAGYFVRRIFNRRPNDVEVLQWNILADLP